ncbi:hypothetical protein C8R45DRAFT_931048 [Mycena sanguinolenta]|nr:hypothetical protein C8R45DRAFT_931048 [Mycena sanguinolenta]
MSLLWLHILFLSFKTIKKYIIAVRNKSETIPALFHHLTGAQPARVYLLCTNRKIPEASMREKAGHQSSDDEPSLKQKQLEPSAAGAWPLVRSDSTLRVLDPTFADSAPTGTPGPVGTSIDDPRLMKRPRPPSISAARQMTRAIVVGGGLAGLIAAHAVLEQERSTFLLDNKPWLGDNSVKASPEINDVGTKVQAMLGIEHSAQLQRYRRLRRSDLTHPELTTSLTQLRIYHRLAHGHLYRRPLIRLAPRRAHHPSHASRRVHWAIMSALMKKLTVRAGRPMRVEIVKNARVEWESCRSKGQCALATGGYAASVSPTGVLAHHFPALLASRQTATTPPATACASPTARPCSSSTRFVREVDEAVGCEAIQRVEGAGQHVLRECVVQDVKKEALCTASPFYSVSLFVLFSL